MQLLGFAYFRRWWGLLGLILWALSCGQGVEPGGVSRDLFPIPEEALRTSASGRHGGELHYAFPGEPNSFNPTAVADTRTQAVTYLLTGSLLEFDRKAQEVREGLVRHWEPSEDAQSVLLTLRAGVSFSDGSPVTVEDVLFSVERIFDPDSRNQLKPSLEMDGKPLSAERAGEHQVLIRFPEAHAAWEFLLTTVPVLPKHLLNDPSKSVEEYWNLGVQPGEIAGLGPFALEEHVPGEKTVLRRNPHYWKVDRSGRRLPYVDRLVIHYIEDRNAQLLRFQAGELDLLDYQLRPQDFQQLKQSGSAAQLVNAGASTHLTFMWFNLSPEAGRKGGRSNFQDARFRRAMAGTVSREAIVRNVFLGQASAAYSILPETITAWHSAPRQPALEADTPKNLLKEAGFSWRRDGTRELLVDPRGQRVEFSLLTRADEVWGRIAALIQQDLETLGIGLSIVQEETRSVISRITQSMDYDAALLAIEVPYEPADQMGTFLSSSPQHFWNPSQASPATPWEAEVDRLMLRQVTTLDPVLRRHLYRDAQQLLIDNVAILPLVNRDVLVAAAPQLRNLRPANLYPNTLWNAWELWLEE